MGLDITLEKLSKKENKRTGSFKILRVQTLTIFKEKDWLKFHKWVKKNWKEEYEDCYLLKEFIIRRKSFFYNAEETMKELVGAYEGSYLAKEYFSKKVLDIKGYGTWRLQNLTMLEFIRYDFDKLEKEYTKEERLFIDNIWDRIIFDWSDPYLIPPYIIMKAYELINKYDSKWWDDKKYGIMDSHEKHKPMKLKKVIEKCIDEELSIVAG